MSQYNFDILKVVAENLTLLLGPIPIEYRGIYPVEYMVHERDECNCSIYNETLSCLAGACINPFTHDTMQLGETYTSPSVPCMSFTCTETQSVDIDGCGEVEYTVEQCEEVYTETCPYGYEKMLIHVDGQCCPEVECACNMCRVNDTYLTVSNETVELSDCQIGLV